MASPPSNHEKVELTESDDGGKTREHAPPEPAPPEPAPPPDADLVRTFRLMMYRRWARQCNGHYEKKSKWRLFWPVLLILLFLLLAGVLSFEKSDGRVVDKIIVTLFILCLVYIMAKVTLRFRWSLYWIALTAIILFFLNPTVSDRTSISSPTAIVLLCFVGLELLTFLVYQFLWHIYPHWICDAPWLNATWWWRIRWRPKSQRYSYQVLDALIWRPVTRHFSYSGPLHPDTRRPHGFGTWVDTSITGERYSGYFDDGVPVGPSKSVEVGSGHGFAAIRIACVSASADGWDDPVYFPKARSDGDIAYAIASSECSVSGKFYIELPKARLITPELTPRAQLDDPIAFVLQKLNLKEFESAPAHTAPARAEINVSWSEMSSQWKIDGYIPRQASGEGSRNGSQVTIVRSDDGSVTIEDWVPLHSESTYEALVFIPGFNCSLQFATQNLSQMLTLGKYPSYIKPFVFSWPSGRIVTYHAALRICESEKSGRDLMTFLNDLRQSKQFRGVHIIAHSMGARLFLRACDQLDAVFDSQQQFQLYNVLFMNPEANLQAFVDAHYSQLQQHCRQITIYGNENDGALGPAEWFSRQKMLGFYTTSTLNHRRPVVVRALGRGSALARARRTSVGSTGPELHVEIPILSQPEIDVDLIDTTYLDANVHEVKHSYFSLNRSMVDDMREVILRRERARYRTSRLIHIDGNVYTFLNAPSYVVSA